ncbi:hypothetical protein GCM10009816_04440 [Microbacterium aquimaris]
MRDQAQPVARLASVGQTARRPSGHDHVGVTSGIPAGLIGLDRADRAEGVEPGKPFLVEEESAVVVRQIERDREYIVVHEPGLRLLAALRHRGGTLMVIAFQMSRDLAQ